MDNETIDNTGMSLGLTFIVIGIFVQIFFLNSEIALWIATFLISFGIGGVGIEREKVPYGEGYEDIGVGSMFFLPSFLMLLKFSAVWIRVFAFLPLMVGVFGLISGIDKQLKVRKVESKSSSPARVGNKLELTFSLAGFISNILTIVSFFLI